ncbi:hypothetical protein ACWDRB_66405 [Nonomuraea sp. NPDC003707]
MQPLAGVLPESGVLHCGCTDQDRPIVRDRNVAVLVEGITAKDAGWHGDVIELAPLLVGAVTPLLDVGGDQEGLREHRAAQSALSRRARKQQPAKHGLLTTSSD